MVGGGCAGVAAAIAAARAGADTMLLESSLRLGGLATVGLVNLLLTMDDGEGNQVVAGLCQEFVDHMLARGRCVHPPEHQWAAEEASLVERWRHWGLIWGHPESVRYSVAYDPEAFVDVSIELMRAAGVRLRLASTVVRAAAPAGRVEAVVVESKRGREAILPAAVVDATGDLDVAVSAGAPHEAVSIPPHLWFRAGGVTEPGPMAFRTLDKGRVLVPWGPLADRRTDPTDPDDVTETLLECRRAAAEVFAQMKRDLPGWNEAWLDDYAGILDITESRRLMGDHVLTREDGQRRFPDTVARTGHWTRRGVTFDIPLRALTTAAVTNLAAAGRCISTTRYVHQATKEIPAAMATGQAAGEAAAMAASSGVAVGAVDVESLRRRLSRAGAVV